MDMVFWRSTPDHTLASVFKELAKDGNRRITVVCMEDIKPHRKKMGWVVPDFGKAELLLLPETGWTEQIVRIINNNIDSIHILSPFFKHAKMRYALLNITKRRLKYGLMTEMAVNQECGIKWLPREIYLQSIAKLNLMWLLRNSLFLLYIDGERRGYTYFKKLVQSTDQIFPFGYFPEVLELLPDVQAPPKVNNEGKVEMIYLGQLIQRKGVNLLIKALSNLGKYPLNYRCHVVGAGPYSKELENLSSSMGLQEKVSFHGPLPYNGVKSLLKKCDILIAPGLKPEPWPLPVSEAIQSGLAVVVSDSIGGGSDLARASGAGLVFPCGEVDSLAQHLYKFIADPHALAMAKKKATKFAWRLRPSVAAQYLLDVINYTLGESSERPVAPWLQSEIY